MKKMKKVIAIVVGIIVLLGVVLLFNFYPMLVMKPVQTGKVSNTDVYAAKNKLNSLYLVPTEKGYILIDAGSDAKVALSALKELSIDPEDIRYVLLTHSDYDHTGTLEQLPNAQIYMGEDELQLLNGTTKRNLFQYNTLPDGVKEDEIQLLRDQQALDLGGTQVICYKTPGHTPGSMSFLVDQKYLFTGDAAQVDEGLMKVHPYTMDKETAEKSIQKIAGLCKKDQYLFTAHYGVLPGSK